MSSDREENAPMKTSAFYIKGYTFPPRRAKFTKVLKPARRDGTRVLSFLKWYLFVRPGMKEP